jgi:glycine dehydrogenase subunit 1
MANIFMDVYGRVGIRELAERNLAKAAYARRALGAKAKVLFDGAPRFNEFVLQTSRDANEISEHLAATGKIIGGFPIRKFYPELGNSAVWCATELTSRATIDAAAREVNQ